MEEKYLTIKEASEYLGCSRVWVDKLIKRGLLTPYQKGAGPMLLKEADLVEFNKPKKAEVQ